jgi:hypothetical protein
MANINAPFGFSAYIYGTSGTNNQQQRVYYIPSTDTSAYYVGDVVYTVDGGDAQGTPAVAKCTSGQVPRGTVTGVLLANPNNPSIQGVNLDLTITSVPAAKNNAYYVFVNDDPDQAYLIQGDSTTFATTDLNKNASYTVAAPSQANQVSATVLTGTTTSSTAVLKILGIEPISTNSLGPYTRFIVVFNNAELERPTAGI